MGLRAGRNARRAEQWRSSKRTPFKQQPFSMAMHIPAGGLGSCTWPTSTEQPSAAALILVHARDEVSAREIGGWHIVLHGPRCSGVLVSASTFLYIDGNVGSLHVEALCNRRSALGYPRGSWTSCRRGSRILFIVVIPTQWVRHSQELLQEPWSSVVQGRST